jgi:hypothetical protein
MCYSITLHQHAKNACGNLVYFTVKCFFHSCFCATIIDDSRDQTQDCLNGKLVH